jgi:tetratricopeptide (TPR) repeat protein
MKRHLCALVLSLTLPVLATAADGTTLKSARQRLLRGNTDEAVGQYEELAKDAKQKSAAASGLSRCYEAQGDYDKALSVVEEALKSDAKSLDLLSRRAELLYLRGRWDDAEKAAQSAIDIDKQGVRARWVRVQVWRDRGELEKAKRELPWFTRLYNETEVKDPDDLYALGLAVSEYTRWKKGLADDFKTVIGELYDGALRADKDFWPAEYQAGRLLLEKYNTPDALKAFDKVLTINPNAPEPYVGKALMAIERLELREAEDLIERALKSNPHHPEALRLRADLHIIAGDYPAALTELDAARKVNPRDEETLGRVAACLFLQRKQADFDALAAEVAKNDSVPAVFYHQLGERLEERRRYEDAEKFYKKAVELRDAKEKGVDGPPMSVAAALNSLGLLYMRMGEEKEARKALDTAFKLDPFNVRVSNTLTVLDHLAKYQTIKTEHFELRYDEKNDGAFAQYIAGYLEEIYAGLAKQFDYRPKGPILIEVFKTHEMFSGRVVALPDLHTIGACTGRMFAMVSPYGTRGGKKLAPFNWARVLRHEMVHIFNLEQTHFLVPHWLTEGLAVTNEGFPRPQPWNALLLKRVPAGELMTLDNIDLGFMRPKGPDDWSMAYCQSQLYVEYLKLKFGERVVGELLAAYADGLSTDAVLSKVCKVDKANIEKGYRDYLDGVVKEIKAKPPDKAMTFSQLRDALKKEPDNADLKARLAEAYYSRDKAEARKLAKEVLAGKPNHPLASYVLGRLTEAAGDRDEAIKLLEGGLDKNSPEPKVLRELAKMYYNSGQFDKAAEAAEQGRRVEPYERQWLVELARVYSQTNDRARQIAVLKDLVPTDADDFDNRKRLAKMLLEADKNDEAEKYARQALEIDFRDKETQDLYEKALRGQGKKAEADKFREIVEK